MGIRTGIRLATAMATAMAAIGATPAAASGDWDRGERQQIVVPSAGLDLSSDAGIDILAARIDRAVRRICAHDRQCQDEAWASTQRQVARAIDRARIWRRLASERAAQLRACRDRCVRPAAAYAPPPPATTIIIIR